MSKKILIIGGTYFLGRVFSILAYREGYELTFINRGRFSMKNLGEHIHEFVCDRHDTVRLQTLELDTDYDALVDFCAIPPATSKLYAMRFPAILHSIFISAPQMCTSAHPV